MLEFSLQKFNGPLDLLLSLLDERELSINEIALSEVTDQYVRYIDTLEEVEPAELADFLVVATRLLLLKSKQLLPQFLPEEEDEGDLAEQLRRYKQFVEVSKKINDLWNQPTRGYQRFEPVQIEPPTELPANVTFEALSASMKRLLYRISPPKPLPRTHIDATVSLKEKINHLRSLLRRKKQLTFWETIGDKNNKTELIVGFLAMLELVKQKTVVLEQKQAFDDILIVRQK